MNQQSEINPTDPEPYPACNGEGKVKLLSEGGREPFLEICGPLSERCVAGHRHTPADCEECAGTGFVSEEE